MRMRMKSRTLLPAILISVPLAVPAAAQVAPADYDRAMGLRDRWIYLTENVGDPVTWIDGTARFYYRKSVKGGFQFVVYDAQTQQRQPAFDHDKLAAALGTSTGARTRGCGCRSRRSGSSTTAGRSRSR